MNTEKVNQAIIEIILKKNELDAIDYSNDKYDDIEEELHDLEDAFLDEYGNELESEITKIHKKICPKSDVLLPIAYIGKSYFVDNQGGEKLKFEREPGQGVSVEIKGFESEDTKLLLMPNPLRLVLTINDKSEKEVWKA